MPRQQLTPEQMQQIVDDWNAKHPVGTHVVVHRGNQDFYTRTRSGADLVEGLGFPVIYVEGLNGHYPLDWVRVIKGGLI